MSSDERDDLLKDITYEDELRDKEDGKTDAKMIEAREMAREMAKEIQGDIDSDLGVVGNNYDQDQEACEGDGNTYDNVKKYENYENFKADTYVMGATDKKNVNMQKQAKENTIESIQISDKKVKGDSFTEPLGKRIIKEVWSYIKLFIIAALIAVVINSFLIINATVPTGSMENTIMEETRIIGSRLSYVFGEPERGDIIVFKYPLDESKNYVKRLIGLPGETVEIKKGEIFIYDKDGNCLEGPLEETYLKEEWTNGNDGYTFKVPNDCYLFLGDNRNRSSDARDWYGMIQNNPGKYGSDINKIYVKKDKLLGKVLFSYWHKGFDFEWLDGENVKY